MVIVNREHYKQWIWCTTTGLFRGLKYVVFHTDPRHWTRDHVTLWLLHAGTQYQLGDTHPERFPMNGKSLLLMSRDMFMSRVPEGGGILFEDIQLKLQKVITELYERVDLNEQP